MIVHIQKPYYQAIAFIALTILILIITRPKNEDTIWTIAGALYVLFILSNTVILFWQPNQWSYFFLSLLVSVAYLFLIEKVCEAFISMTETNGSGESSMIFLVIIYHPIALLMMMVFKWGYFKFF